MASNTQKNILIITLITTLILLTLEIYAIKIDSDYKLDIIPLLLLLYIFYFARNKLRLSTLTFLCIAIMILLHNLGIFGLYENSYFGLEYDFYIHFLNGYLGAYMLFNLFTQIKKFNGNEKYIAILILALATSAFHELVEFFGALVFGNGEGLLMIGAGDVDPWDTQKDIFNGLFGAFTALIYPFLTEKK